MFLRKIKVHLAGLAAGRGRRSSQCPAPAMCRYPACQRRQAPCRSCRSRAPQCWRVSNAAIVRRAYDLGLIDAIKYRNANIHLRKTGQSKEEIYDDKITQEQPELIKNAFKVLREEEKDGLLMILDQLKIRPDFFRKLLGGVELNPEDFIRKTDSPNIIRFPSQKR